jgi:hypothetical protein
LQKRSRETSKKPKVYPHFINWIYRDQLPPFVLREWYSDDNLFLAYTKILLPLFQLAEKICLNELANKVMDRIQDLHPKQQVMFCHRELKVVYENTRPKSKLRVYGVLNRVRCASFGFPQNDATEDGHGDGRILDEEDTEESAVEALTALGRSTPEFAEDFIQLSLRYASRFQKRDGGVYPDLQVRTSESEPRVSHGS